MIKVRKIDDKTIGITDVGKSEQEAVVSAVFYAFAKADIVSLHSKHVLGRKVYSAPYADFEVNGVSAFANAQAVVSALNEFVGNFNPAGGTAQTTLPDFEPNKAYKEHQAIVRDGVIYTAKADFTAGASFDAADWNKVGVSESELDNYLPLAGGVMSGDIGMGNKNLTGAELVEARYFRSPDHEDDSAVYVLGELRVAGNRVGEVGDPITAPDATNKGYVDAADSKKADKIITPHIDWNPDAFNIPAGRTLHFNTDKTPTLSGTGLPTIAKFAIVNGNPELMFGFYSNDGGATTQAGMFHINDDMTAFVPDILLYDGMNWINGGDYILRYGISGDINQSIGTDVTLSGFDLANDINVPDVPIKNLIDVENEVQQKQNRLVAGDNIEIRTTDPLHPVIRAKAVLPDVNLPDGQVADAKKTAALIAAAAATNRDRGVVISAYADRQVYAADTITINYRGGGYAVGDSLQYAAGLMDVLIVVTEIGSGDSIEAFTVSSKGASLDDFAGTDLPFTTSGAGTLATFDIATAQEAGRKLADVVNPQEGDTVRVLLDETHANQMWQWVMSDTNADGIANWIGLSPAGINRDFFSDPIQTAEIDGKAVTDGKVADYATDTAIIESNSKFLGGIVYTFTELKKAFVAKTNALFTNKVDKTAGTNKVYGTDATGAQTTYSRTDFTSIKVYTDGNTAADTWTIYDKELYNLLDSDTNSGLTFVFKPAKPFSELDAKGIDVYGADGTNSIYLPIGIQGNDSGVGTDYPDSFDIFNPATFKVINGFAVAVDYLYDDRFRDFIESVDGVTGEGSRNVQLTRVYATEAEFEADKDNIPNGTRVVKLYEYPDNLAGVIPVPDYEKIATTNLFEMNKDASGHWLGGADITETGSIFIGGYIIQTSGTIVDLYMSIYVNSNRIFWFGTTDIVLNKSYYWKPAPIPVKKGDFVYVTITSSGNVSVPNSAVITVNSFESKLIPPVLVAKQLPVVVEKNGSYSLDEIKTADTWINGKPIYKRTFTVQVTSTSAGETIRTTLPNSRIVDMDWGIPVKVEGTWQVGTSTLPPYNIFWNFAVGDDVNQSWWSYQTIDGYLNLSVHTKTTNIRTNWPVYVTFYYTKMSD